MVQDLLSRRQISVTEAEQKEKIKERNRAAYERSRDEMQVLRARLEGFVSSGGMSQCEMDKVMLSKLRGQYRVRYQEEMAKRELGTLQGIETKFHAGQVAYQNLRAHTEMATQKIKDARNVAADLTTILTNIFNGKDQEASMGHLRRNGITWPPNEPSPEAFYMIYALVTPVGNWPPDGAYPDVSEVFKTVNLRIHPDKASEEHIAGIGGHRRLNELQDMFMKSKRLVDEFLKNPGRLDKNRWLQAHWERAKFDVLKAMRPNSTTISPYMISFWVDDAARKLGDRRPQ